jgi:hypothetical protein
MSEEWIYHDISLKQAFPPNMCLIKNRNRGLDDLHIFGTFGDHIMGIFKNSFRSGK